MVPSSEIVFSILKWLIPKQLDLKLVNFTFGIEIDIYLRLIVAIDGRVDTVYFYCDIEDGEELFLLEKTNMAGFCYCCR